MGIASAIIGGAAAIGGSLLSSSSQKKAANRAAETAENTAAQNNALAREIYGQNKATLNPFVQRGNAAGDALNALLLGPQASSEPQFVRPQVRPNALSQFNPDLRFNQREGGYTPAALGYGIADGQYGYGTNALLPSTQSLPQQAATDPNSAFDVFRNNTGYQFRLGESLDAVNSNYFGAGVGQSGAALKALQDRAGAVADNTFGQYAGLLANQQGVGLSAAGAQAGVSTNFVNQVSGNNNAAGTAVANAALASGNNGFGNALAQIGGTILGSQLG